MHLTKIVWQRLSAALNTSKTGFGPYRQHRRGEHFVGTEPNTLKYHLLQDKAPLEPYGLQGNNHLYAAKGKVASKLPTKVFMKKDKVYAWCICGYSGSQPLCDGSHRTHNHPNKGLRPVRFIPDKDMEVWLCNCKQTENRPFCDGSHKNLKDKDDKESLFE